MSNLKNQVHSQKSKEGEGSWQDQENASISGSPPYQDTSLVQPIAQEEQKEKTNSDRIGQRGFEFSNSPKSEFTDYDKVSQFDLRSGKKEEIRDRLHDMANHGRNEVSIEYALQELMDGAGSMSQTQTLENQGSFGQIRSFMSTNQVSLVDGLTESIANETTLDATLDLNLGGQTEAVSQQSSNQEDNTDQLNERKS